MPAVQPRYSPEQVKPDLSRRCSDLSGQSAPSLIRAAMDKSIAAMALLFAATLACLACLLDLILQGAGAGAPTSTLV